MEQGGEFGRREAIVMQRAGVGRPRSWEQEMKSAANH